MTTTTVPTVAERVQAGVAWLDEHEPGWMDRIDLSILHLDHCGLCVLGQLFGDFWAAPLGVRPFSTDELYAYADNAVPLGFTGTRDGRRYGTDDEYAELTQAWRELISARRAGGVS